MNTNILLKQALAEIKLHPVYNADNFSDSLVFHLADILINQSNLQAGHRKYRVTEIEFYLQQQGHDDPFVPGHDRNPVGKIQSTFGNWLDDNGGLEYSIGEPLKFRSILISGLQRLDKSKELIQGKWNVRNELLEQTNNDLIRQISFQISKSRDEKLLCTKRKILQTSRSSYRDLPYRFMPLSVLAFQEDEKKEILEFSVRYGLLSKEESVKLLQTE